MRVVAAFVLFAAFFLIANRGAYKGYFDGDDIDNIMMTNSIGLDLFVQNFLSPKLDESNFRPVGHAFYRFYGRPAQLNFPLYIAFIHAVHLLNVILLWLLLRALGFAPLNSATGLLLFAFNMGTFEIYWKPMYVFDLFCATFTIASLLLWVHDRWILSLVAFWCAFKSKEVAIALPAVLALLEVTLGKRRWKRLIPFFVVSLSFGLQAIVDNRARDNSYTLRFSLEALKTCLAFYGNRILVFPLGGAFLAALFLLRDKWARFGVLGILLLMGPMLFLPGRLFGAYLYVPLIGLAIAAAAFSRKAGFIPTAILLLIWIPLNYREMQTRRREQLAISDENRGYVTLVRTLMAVNPATDTFIFDKSPEGLHYWGVRAAVRYATLDKRDVKQAEARTPEALALAKEQNLAYLIWNPEKKQLNVVHRTPATPDIPYIAMNNKTPLWQLSDGWHGVEGNFQWTGLTAHARIARPPEAKRLEVVVNVGPLLIEKLKKVKLEVFLDGAKIGEEEFTTVGWHKIWFDVPPSKSDTAQVEFKTSPGYFYEDHNPADALGIAVGGFGFPTPQYPAILPTQ